MIFYIFSVNVLFNKISSLINKKLSFKVDFLSLYNEPILMNIIKDLNDLPSNIFGFSPEDLSPSEKKTPLGTMFIEIKKVRDKLGLKCRLLPSFLTNTIVCIGITESDFKKLIAEFDPKNYTYTCSGDTRFIHLTI